MKYLFIITLLLMLPVQSMSANNPVMAPIINYLLFSSETTPTPVPILQKYIVTPIVGTSSQVLFTITLTEKPDSNVTISYSSLDETVALPTTTQIVITPDDWYVPKRIYVDILEKSSSTEIIFEPTVSDDLIYNNVLLGNVPIVSHQILIHKPYDTVVYSEFNTSIPIDISYVGDDDANLSVILESAPPNMIFNGEIGKLVWKPEPMDEDTNTTVELTVSDGKLSETLNFSIHVAKPVAITTIIENDTLVVADSSSSLNGLSIKSLDGALLSEYRLYHLLESDAPALPADQFAVGETLLIKGNIGKKVQITLPLQGIVATDELLSFHLSSYFGSQQWQRIDYEYNFFGTADEPIYELNTSNFFGVVSFIKKSQNKQTVQKTAMSQQTTQSTTGIYCEPQTWSLFGLPYDLIDYDNQICTFDESVGFTLQIFNYTDISLSSFMPIEEMASWVLQAQKKLVELYMPFKSYSAFSFQKIKKARRVGETGSYDSVNRGMFIDYPTILDFKLSTLDPYRLEDNTRTTQITTYHEYFHQSQATVENSTITNPKATWLLESSAVWFSDYVDNNSGYAYEMFLDHIRLLSYGLSKIKTVSISEGFRQNTTYFYDSNYYHRGIFLEMIDNYCPDFTNYIPYLFSSDVSDPTSLQHLSNVVNASQCNFGTPTGAGNESRLETALLYYQYISAIKNDKYLINPNLNQYFGFSGSEVLQYISSNNWLQLSMNEYRNIPYYDYFNPNSIDSQAMTIKFDHMQDTISRCEERYIRINSEKIILLSLASEDISFPDTPNTMLGDMKQINFAMIGETDFTYFYDSSTGKQIYPELYLTVIDIVDDVATLRPQKIDIGIGLRRTNLISHLDGKDMCADSIPAITETTVIANGDIPEQYRNSNDSLQYIDRIKMTCTESGEVFNAIVGNDGTWSSTINITFNNNKSHFSIEGYNALDDQRIIAYEVLTIVK